MSRVDIVRRAMTPKLDENKAVEAVKKVAKFGKDVIKSAAIEALRKNAGAVGKVLAANLKEDDVSEVLGYDDGPGIVELTEGHSLKELHRRRAFHDVQGRIHTFASGEHEREATRHIGSNDDLANFHSGQASYHADRAARHDQAWETAHSLVSRKTRASEDHMKSRVEA